MLDAWQGLGYYRRAENLHLAAKQMMAHHQGVFPDTFEAVAALPGVGRYTAGAVLCFAFGKRAPILDTNVRTRAGRACLCGVQPPATGPCKNACGVWPKRCYRTGTDAWVINQAMMDLGATICTARTPRCTQCCLQAICHAAPSMNSQMGLFPYPDITESTVPMAAEAEAPEYR